MIACQRAQSFAYRRGCHLPATCACPLGWPRTSPWLHLLLLLRSSACGVATNGKHRDADMLPVHACNSLSPGLWESVDTSSSVGPIVAVLLRRSAIHLPFVHTRRHCPAAEAPRPAERLRLGIPSSSCAIGESKIGLHDTPTRVVCAPLSNVLSVFVPPSVASLHPFFLLFA